MKSSTRKGTTTMTLKLLLVLILTLGETPAAAAAPTDVLGTIPLTASDTSAVGTNYWMELGKALRAGPAAVESLFAGLRTDLARGLPRGNDLGSCYDRLAMFLDPTTEIVGADSAVSMSRTWFASDGDSLTKRIVRLALPAAGRGAPTNAERLAVITAALAGDLGRQAERESDPQLIVLAIRLSRLAKRPDAEVETLMRRVMAMAPRYTVAAFAFVGSTFVLTRGETSAATTARLGRLAVLAPDLVPTVTTTLALQASMQPPGQGFTVDMAAVRQLPRDTLRETLRSRKPGNLHGWIECLGWLRLAAIVDDQEVAAAAARRMALFPGPPSAVTPTDVPPLLAWARGQGPRPGAATPHLRWAARHRRAVPTSLVNELQDRTTYAPGPLAVDVVLPPRPADPWQAWAYDRAVAGYAAHGVHDPALDARTIELLDRYAMEAQAGLTDRRVWLALRDDFRSLMAAGSKDPLVRHATAYLNCVAGEDGGRAASLNELYESALALARSPYQPACAFWAMDEYRWMSTELGISDFPPATPRSSFPPLDQLAFMVSLLERTLADPKVPDFAAHDAARRAIEIGAVDAPDVQAFVRAARPTEAVALAVEGEALKEAASAAWGDRDTRDLSAQERETIFSTLEAADDRLERALSLSPNMYYAAISSIWVARARFLSSGEIQRRIERARRLRPRHFLTWQASYSLLLGPPRRTDIPDRIERVLDSLDAMLADASSWDASAVLSLVTAAHLKLAREDLWAVWKDEFGSRPEGASLKLLGRFREPKRAAQIRKAVAHTLANTDGTLRSKRDHGHAALLLFMLGDENEALRHFVAAGKTIPDDEPGANWVHNVLWYRLPENLADPRGEEYRTKASNR